MKKKVLALLLASAMVASMAACGNNDEPAGTSDAGSTTPATSTGSDSGAASTSTGSDAPAEPYNLTSLKVLVDGTVNSVKQETEAQNTVREVFIPQLEEAIGAAIGHEIDIEFEVGNHTKYSEDVGRRFVAEDYPDVMIMSANMMKQYSTTGLLWDMADAYANAEFQSRITLPAINENMKDSQGHLYGFAPTYGNGCITYVKQSWLDAVGIKGDDVKTYEDFYNMLLAFKNGDPDGNGVEGDTYGFISAGLIGGEAPYINYTAEFWQDSYPGILQGEDGKWYDGFQTDATKAALKRLQEAYAAGVIDPDSFTAGTKQAREKWWGAEQSGSAGAFSYWAGNWYKNLNENLEKNNLPSEVYQLAPIKEITDNVGGYLNRESPVWVILDDGDGDDSREQAIFDAFIETMLDGDTIQSLWTYGARDLEWSTKAESFTLNANDPEKKKDYNYEEGQFHYRPSVAEPETKLSSKNHLDPALVIAPLTNGFVVSNDLETVSNQFFTSHCVDAPSAPTSDTYSQSSGDLLSAVQECVAAVVVRGEDVDASMETYVNTVGSLVEEILAELNAE